MHPFAIAAFCLASLCVGLFVGRPRWNRRYVDAKTRGPTADSEYPSIIVGGEDYWFTDEQLAVARERADRLSSHQRGDPRNL